MKIYTKTGDIGETSLFGGRRVSKSDLRIETYGTTDELNSWIGLLRDVNTNEKDRELLKEIQDRIFTLGAELAADLGWRIVLEDLQRFGRGSSGEPLGKPALAAE